FDALRIILRGGDAPNGYAGAATPAVITSARTAFNTALAATSSIYRPVQTWTVEIPVTSQGRAIYPRVSDGVQVMLLDASGDRFALEQGMGLRPGS
ncbi:hypothetical protein L9G15_22335, partial [Shewanella sp. A3A]|nr:hypothetical protein [Shewanella ferrihydritica]